MNSQRNASITFGVQPLGCPQSSFPHRPKPEPERWQRLASCAALGKNVALVGTILDARLRSHALRRARQGRHHPTGIPERGTKESGWPLL